MRDMGGGDAPKGSGLAAVIQKAKEDKRRGRFRTLVGTVFHMWYYQYVDNYHCHPTTIEDLTMGIKYLLFSRKDQ